MYQEIVDQLAAACLKMAKRLRKLRRWEKTQDGRLDALEAVVFAGETDKARLLRTSEFWRKAEPRALWRLLPATETVSGDDADVSQTCGDCERFVPTWGKCRECPDGSEKKADVPNTCTAFNEG